MIFDFNPLRSLRLGAKQKDGCLMSDDRFQKAGRRKTENRNLKFCTIGTETQSNTEKDFGFLSLEFGFPVISGTSNTSDRLLNQRNNCMHSIQHG